MLNSTLQPRLRRFLVTMVCASVWALVAQVSATAGPHEEYAQQLWDFLHQQNRPYTSWTKADSPRVFDFGPPNSQVSKTYYNTAAARDPGKLPQGSLVVTEHYDPVENSLLAITARYRAKSGFDPQHSDWYWVHYLPDGTLVKSSAKPGKLARPGYVTSERDGRLWVFRAVSPELIEFHQGGELAKHVTRPGAGPGGITLKGPDAETLDGYTFQRDGFATAVIDGRLWVLRAGSPEHAEFQTSGELAKHVTRPGGGPDGMTLKGADAESLDDYLYGKPGFVIAVEDGRLWIFRDGSQELSDYREQGELAKHVIRPGAGPNGMTLKSPDAETIEQYLYSQPGFLTVLVDGRLWVFRTDSSEFQEFQDSGELAKHVTRPGGGPGGVTIKAADAETIDDYLSRAR